MNERIKAYVDSIFTGAPSTKKILDLKEEMLSNMNSRYDELLKDGFTPDDAYHTVVVGVGDISELLRQIQNETAFNAQFSQKDRQKNAIFVSVAVMLFVLAPVTLIAVDAFAYNSVLGVVAMLTLVALGVGMLVYNALSKPKYVKEDETIVEEFKEWKSKNSETKRLRGAISSVLWTLIVIIYFAVSFLLGAWPISWIIFIIGACIEAVIGLIFTIKGE